MGVIQSIFFFCQAEDGIRYTSVTGVQTCALPISDLFSQARESLQAFSLRGVYTCWRKLSVIINALLSHYYSPYSLGLA